MGNKHGPKCRGPSKLSRRRRMRHFNAMRRQARQMGDVDSTKIQQVKLKNEHSEPMPIKEEIVVVLEAEEIEKTIESSNDIKKSDNESVSDAPCQTQPNEELVVRRQLCRGCHSDGAFWSLQTTTEGDTYEDLLQIYFNVQLCQVSETEGALSAICKLCAARLREARAFFTQLLAAEERFTRFYKENRVRVLINEEDIKKEVQETFHGVLVNGDKIKKEVPETLHKVPVNEEDIKKEVPETFHEGEPKRDSERKKVKKKRLVKKQQHLADIDDASDNTRPIASRSNRTPVYRLKPSDYERIGDTLKCTRCEKQFTSRSGLRSHVRNVHMNITRYTCTLCVKNFRWLIAFTKHKLDEHSIDDRVKCNACDRMFNTRRQLDYHKNVFHMLGVKHSCTQCDFECYSLRSLHVHNIKHKSVKEYKCTYCCKAFLRKSNLDLHERIHTGDRRKICNECGQAFVQKASLNYHMAKYHPEVKF